MSSNEPSGGTLPVRKRVYRGHAGVRDFQGALSVVAWRHTPQVAQTEVRTVLERVVALLAETEFGAYFPRSTL